GRRLTAFNRRAVTFPLTPEEYPMPTPFPFRRVRPTRPSTLPYALAAVPAWLPAKTHPRLFLSGPKSRNLPCCPRDNLSAKPVLKGWLRKWRRKASEDAPTQAPARRNARKVSALAS